MALRYVSPIKKPEPLDSSLWLTQPQMYNNRYTLCNIQRFCTHVSVPLVYRKSFEQNLYTLTLLPNHLCTYMKCSLNHHQI